MLNILYLVHRLPYPPNKGDKVRSFNILKYISLNNNVFLGTFIDEPDDEQFIPFVKNFCKILYVEKINKKYSKFCSLSGFFKNNSLTVNYYKSKSFNFWVNNIVNNNKIDIIIVFSSVMAQFINKNLYSKMLVDFVDVDSHKWSEYAEKKSFPISLIYKRESKYLLSYERYLAQHAKHSFFVTDKEKALFSSVAPESKLRTSALNNGVDFDFFSPGKNIIFPFESTLNKHIHLVFTGAMDYWPNIDAVIWFVKNVFSELIKRYPNILFHIVGRAPSIEVLNLNSKKVFVTGTVNDVRPYLQHATVVVAPLRVARGIQNKILEAMAMAKPVVASLECVKAINVLNGVDILSANSALEFIQKIEFLINNENKAESIGYSARVKVMENYSWSAHLKEIDKYFLVGSKSGTE